MTIHIDLIGFPAKPDENMFPRYIVVSNNQGDRAQHMVYERIDEGKVAEGQVAEGQVSERRIAEQQIYEEPAAEEHNMKTVDGEQTGIINEIMTYVWWTFKIASMYQMFD